MANFYLEKITSEKERSRFISLTTLIFALFYHICIQFTFYKLQIFTMVYYNIFSIVCFISLIIVVTKVRSFVIPYMIACSEVIVHQILADIFLGTKSGFHYFILLMGLLPFLVFGNKFRYSIPATIVTSIIFILIENINLSPFYDVSDTVIRIIKYLNVFFSIAMIVISNIIHTFIVYRVEKNLEHQNKTLENEIKMASVIQQNFFKQDTSKLKKVDIAYYSRAMAGVSGDIYDIYKKESKLEGVSIFDVSGHGISSGLVTMLVKNIIHQEFYNNKDLELWEILNNINDRVIAEKGDIENYLTGILVRYLGDKLEIAIAGHPQPIFYRKELGRCEFFNPIKESVGAIGIPDLPVFYTSDYIDFDSGDEIVLYSDGISDVLNEENETFGKEKLLQAVQEVAHEDAKTQLEEISKKIRMFRGTKSQTDDITIIILKKN